MPARMLPGVFKSSLRIPRGPLKRLRMLPAPVRVLLGPDFSGFSAFLSLPGTFAPRVISVAVSLSGSLP